MKKLLPLLLMVCLFAMPLQSQVNYTANDQVTPYNGDFRYGANFNYYPPWIDTEIADIAIGNGTLPGIGLNVIRGSLAEEFLEFWGYDIRQAYYQHYESLGANDHLVFAIGPIVPEHKDQTEYCPGSPSELFANLYEPIWDNNNGTPYNEDNYFAAYMYQMVSHYTEHVKFWEIWNEADFSFDVLAAFAPPGQPGNWWDAPPDPCNMIIKAPVYHYIRMLRIGWEVVKTVDPDAYVCTGGIGNPAFLDALCRYTDNPVDGSVSADYPLSGAAYFDVLSYHSYPHFDGSLRTFNGTGWDQHRHSDRAIEGMIGRKNLFQDVMDNYGYDGSDKPEKLWLISETNLPRQAFNPEYIGTDEAQRNYTMKALVAAQMEGIEQLYFYIISDLFPAAQASFEFHTMGLFKNLSQFTYPDYEINEAAIALKTTSDFLYKKEYDEGLTTSLQIPSNIGGAVFTNDQDTVAVLWAKTTEDQSETANAVYSLPAGYGVVDDALYQWDYSQTSSSTTVSPDAIPLTGAPSFFRIKRVGTMVSVFEKNNIRYLSAACFPNPSDGHFQMQLNLEKTMAVEITLQNIFGQEISLLKRMGVLEKGVHVFEQKNNLVAGLYLVKIKNTDGNNRLIKMVVQN